MQKQIYNITLEWGGDQGARPPPAPAASFRSSRRTLARSRALCRLFFTRGAFAGAPALAAAARAALRRCAPLPAGGGFGAEAPLLPPPPPPPAEAAAAAPAAALKQLSSASFDSLSMELKSARVRPE
jgi:hypothetical protein